MHDVLVGVAFAGVVALVTFVGWILLLGYLKANQQERRLAAKDTMVWARSDERARLRARVERLPFSRQQLPGLEAEIVVVLRDDVLALIDAEGSDGPA